MDTSTDKENSTEFNDHATKRVLIILIVGFIIIAFVAPWASG